MSELFGKDVNRTASDSIKWKKYQGRDILPMWVADMDFEVAKPIQEALKNRIDHGVLGYGSDLPELRQAIVDHCQTHYDWQIEPDWIVLTPGVVKGLNIARTISVQNGRPASTTALPVYPHLRHHSPVLSSGDQKFLDQSFETKLVGGEWQLDLNGFEASITDETGVLLLCNPHNPIGKVYSKEELIAIGELCEKHDLIICSDDIHCDLILNDKKHIPIASLSAKLSQRSITLMAPSKTFNVAGLDAAFAIIENPDLRKRYEKLQSGMVGHVNVLGATSALAAFTQGEAWRLELIEYLKENHRLVLEKVNAIDGIWMKPCEATFLAWINVESLGLSHPIKFFEDHGVGMSPGSDFGDGNFVRLNFGCQRPLLIEALDRIEKAVKSLR